MISRIVVAVLVILIGACVGILILNDAGYVLIEYANTTIETSLWLAVFALVLLAGAIYWGYVGYRFLRSSSTRWSSWREYRRKQKATADTIAALKLEVAGDLKGARKLLLDASKSVDAPLLHQIYAADLATRMGEAESSTQLLAKVVADHHELDEWERMRRAENKLIQGGATEAVDVLRELLQKHPKSQTVALALLRISVAAEDWTSAQDLLKDLKSSELITSEELAKIHAQCWRERLSQSSETVSTLWSTTPKDVREDPTVIRTYVRSLVKTGQLDEARAVLTSALGKHWDSELIRDFGLLKLEPNGLLKRAEKWLGDHGNDGALLLSLGRLSKRAEQYSKAREYLEASLRIAEERETYLELAQLCFMTGEGERASLYLERAS